MAYIAARFIFARRFILLIFEFLKVNSVPQVDIRLFTINKNSLIKI